MNDYAKTRLLEFIKKIDQTFAENLKYSISWKVELTEKTTYGIKGDAKRTFICELYLICLDKNTTVL